MEKLEFNLSASSLNLFLSSEVLFYYTYIDNVEPDTYVTPVYGLAGNVVHETLEYYIKNHGQVKKEDIIKLFYDKWEEKEIPKHRAAFGRSFEKKKPDYLSCVKKGMKIVDDLIEEGYTLTAEGEFKFKFLDNKYITCQLKGYIDVIARKGDEIIFIDWKTSSSVDTGDGFKRQSLMYNLLIYLKYKVIPKEARFYYLKILNQPKKYKFKKEEVEEFFEFLKTIVRKILKKGRNIDNYELGDWDTFFNDKKKRCTEIYNSRKKTERVFNLTIANSKINIEVNDERFYKLLDVKYSYLINDRFFSNLYKKRIWDGKKHLLKNKTLNIGFLNNVQEFIKDYCNYYKIPYKINIEDNREQKIVNKKYNIKFKENKFELRYYQKDSVKKAIESKIGIINCCTGTGKSIIAAELIRQQSRLSLVIVNRIELVEQTKEMYEEFLGVKVGSIYEGNANYELINVASIQSLIAILKRKNKDTDELRKILYNTTLTIWDEAQNVVNEGMYGEIVKFLTNNVYFIGTTGTAFRNDEHTLQMNGMVGFPIYNYSYEQALKDGFISEVKSYFIEYEHVPEIGKYPEAYNKNIVNNEVRNNIVIDFVNKHRKNKKILIITKMIEHGELLNNKIDNSYLITGSTERKLRKEWFKDFKENQDKVLIGSQQIFSTGINLPDLDIIISVAGGKSKVLLLQTIGRVMRKSNDKKYGYYIDFFDKSEYLLQASKLRMKTLKDNNRNFSIVKNSSEILIE